MTYLGHDEGVWIDTDGSDLGIGCSDGEDCPVCWTTVESSAGDATFASHDELDNHDLRDNDDDVADLDAAMERVR